MKSFLELATEISKRDAEELARERQERRERIASIQDSKVCGGVFRPEPVNKEAAMLLAKAPWWAHPPSVRQKPEQKKETTMGEMQYTPVHSEAPLAIGKEVVKATNVNGEICYSQADIAAAIIAHLEKTLDPAHMDIAMKAIGWRETLEKATKDIGSAIDEFDAASKAAMNDVRMQRMAVVSECSSMVNAMRDVRQFFLGPDYEREQKRLADFVDLCERLKRLKDSGFLDTVADTMLRLAAYDKNA